jgi:hypothetical protein
MDTFSAFARGLANQGKERKVFDWDKAARRIKETKPTMASAGLAGDWEWTGGNIYINKPVKDYTFLASTWATPELEMDGLREACYIMESETEFDEKTNWPESALKILGFTKEDVEVI